MIHRATACFLAFLSTFCAAADLIKPSPVTLATLPPAAPHTVRVDEVSDYVFGHYAGTFKSPPNADGNPRKAFIVRFGDHSQRLVFWHEASYCPFLELPDGAAVCFQFFEGNDGFAELFNQYGRMEQNSFVDIIESKPERVWIHWTYFGVNQTTGQPMYRGAEDFYAYPDGLVLRRQTFHTLFPNDPHAYAREPIETIAMCPVGQTWRDVLQVNSAGERHALAALDAFSDARYDVWWKPKAQTVVGCTSRREGANWKAIDDAKGVVLALPMKGGYVWCAFGDASGYPAAGTRIKEHTNKDTGGIGWASTSWDHWPVGWLNSQAHEVTAETLKVYPNHFSPAGMDFFAMKNEDVERGVYYSIMGVGAEVEEIRAVARVWLGGKISP